jgi:hypothetical protein
MAGLAKFARSRAYLHLLQCRMHAMAKSHACCGVVRDCCCDVSALRGAVFEFSAPAATAKSGQSLARAETLNCRS